MSETPSGVYYNNVRIKIKKMRKEFKMETWRDVCNKIYYKNLKIKIKNAKSIGNLFTKDEVDFLLQLVENNQNVELKNKDNV